MENQAKRYNDDDFIAAKTTGQTGDGMYAEMMDDIVLLNAYKSGVIDYKWQLADRKSQRMMVSGEEINNAEGLLLKVDNRIKERLAELIEAAQKEVAAAEQDKAGSALEFDVTHQDIFDTALENGVDLDGSLNERISTAQAVLETLQNRDVEEERITQEFEAWREVKGSLESEKPRMALLSDAQLRAEYHAGYVSQEQLKVVRAEHDRQIQGLADPAPVAVNSGRLSNTDEQKFEAWREVMGSLESEKPRMALLSDAQLRAEYQAGEVGQEQLKVVRAEHDRQIQGLADPAPVAVNSGRLSNTDEQKFEAWREVMGSLESEKPRMALLSDAQLRAEYQAGEVGQEQLKVVRAEHDRQIQGLADPAPVAVNSGRLSNTDEQKFEAWRGVMGSLESEKLRMAVLTDSQQRAEYEASQVGPERYQALRAEHDQVNGYAMAKPAEPEKGSLSHWANELREAANKTRRPLSGLEFKQIVNSVENCSRGADMEKAKALEVAGLLAKVHGPSGGNLFRDPELRNAYKAAISPDRSKLQSVAPTNQEAADHVTAKNAKPAAMKMR